MGLTPGLAPTNPRVNFRGVCPYKERMFKKRLKFLLGITVSLLSLTGCRIGEAYDTISNMGVISYTNAAGSEYRETSSATVNLLLYKGPSISIVKTSKNLRNGEEGSNTKSISCVPGDTVELYLNGHNTGDSYAYYVTLVDTFPAGVGDPAGNSMSYVPGSETCAINGSLPADSISWCVDEAHTWNAWQTYNDTVSKSIPDTCTGIRWRWNIVPSEDINSSQSWIRVRYQWLRNDN